METFARPAVALPDPVVDGTAVPIANTPQPAAGFGLTLDGRGRLPSGVREIKTGLASQRPDASAWPGGFYYATDTNVLSYSSGAAWTDFSSFDEDLLPWTIDVNPTLAKANTNWSTIGIDAAAYGNGQINSTGAQNAERSWDIVLAAGTWTVEILHVTSNNRGIYSVQLDDVEKGTIDGYTAATTYNVRASVASIAVATSAKVTFKLKMATKNAASASFFGSVQTIQWRRTA